MRAWTTFALSIATLSWAPAASAQDDALAPAAVDDAAAIAEPPAREVLDAWVRTPAVEAARNLEATTESAAFAHIHDADDGLLELEAARRMVGYDLLDGVR